MEISTIPNINSDTVSNSNHINYENSYQSSERNKTITVKSKNQIQAQENNVEKNLNKNQMKNSSSKNIQDTNIPLDKYEYTNMNKNNISLL